MSTFCLFLPTGKTLTFRGAEVVCDNETVLQLRYTAMSDGLSKLLTVQKNQIVGWAETLDGVTSTVS